MKVLVHFKHILEFLMTGSLIRQIENWFPFLLVYVGLQRSDRFRIRLRTGLQIDIRPRGSDKWAVHEIVLRDDYKLKQTQVQNGVIVDAGSHIGVFSLMAAHAGDRVRVYAIEPAGDNFRLLQTNIALNNLQERIVALNLSLSDKKGRLSLYSGFHSGVTIVDTGGPAIDTEALSLRDFFEAQNIGECELLKLDVEGAEYLILYSTPPEVFRMIRRIFVEFHDVPACRDNTGRALERFLTSQGYHVAFSRMPLARNGYLYCHRPANLDRRLS